MVSVELPPPPPGLRWRSNTFFILSTIAIGLFTDFFLYALVVPLLPFILQDRIGLPHTRIQSATSLLLACYAGASVLFSLPAGMLADRLPTRRLPFLFGLTSLCAATVLLFLGRSLAVLVIARVFQGLSGVIVWTVGLAMITDTVGTEKLGVTIGSMFSLINVGQVAAPALGGVLYQVAGSGAVFGVAFALLALDFIMRLLVVEKKSAAGYGILTSEEDGDPDTADTSQNSSDEESPLLNKSSPPDTDTRRLPTNPPRWARTLPVLYCCLTNPRLFTSQLVAFIQASLFAVFDATLSTEARDRFHFDALQAGLLFLPLLLPYAFLSPLAGSLLDSHGARPIAACGFATIATPLLLLRFVPHDDISLFAACLAVTGAGLAATASVSIVDGSRVVQSLYRRDPRFFARGEPYAQLYALNSVFYCAGLTVGPLMGGWLREAIGYGDMNVVVAGLCVVMLGLSLLYLGGRERR
jgi:MFS family permease